MRVYVTKHDTLSTGGWPLWRLTPHQPVCVIEADTVNELCRKARQLVRLGVLERVPWRDRLRAWWKIKTYRWRHRHGRNTQT